VAHDEVVNVEADVGELRVGLLELARGQDAERQRLEPFRVRRGRPGQRAADPRQLVADRLVRRGAGTAAQPLVAKLEALATSVGN